MSREGETGVGPDLRNGPRLQRDPADPVMIKALQKTDPRCGPPVELTTEEADMLKALQTAMAAKPAGA